MEKQKTDCDKDYDSISKHPGKDIKVFIDVNFDFTSDSPNYWDSFWDKNDGIGVGGSDPDIVSKTLQEYHRTLWSKKLPNGEIMDLKSGNGSEYLTWKDFRFGSDSIIATFRYKSNKSLLDEVSNMVSDYRAFMEECIRRAYTIGGMMIFPKHPGSINQHRGTNPLIRDRWDLTLECIRLFYQGKESPLYSTLLSDKQFFELFIDFKGFTNYFFLQDCVSSDYSSVKIWLGKGDFNEDPLPATVEDYLGWIAVQMDFLDNRNKRIQDYINALIVSGD